MPETGVIAAIASIMVAIVTGAAAIASQRAAARASTLNAQTSSRVDMEREAYERARKFDTDTIERQNKEFTDLHAEHEALKERFRNLESENRDLRLRVFRLENELGITPQNAQKEQIGDRAGTEPAERGQAPPQ